MRLRPTKSWIASLRYVLGFFLAYSVSTFNTVWVRTILLLVSIYKTKIFNLDLFGPILSFKMRAKSVHQSFKKKKKKRNGLDYLNTVKHKNELQIGA